MAGYGRTIFAPNRTTDLDAIDHKKAVETLRNATIQEQVLSVLETTLDEVKPKLDKAIKQRIKDTAKGTQPNTEQPSSGIPVPNGRFTRGVHAQTRSPCW